MEKILVFFDENIYDSTPKMIEMDFEEFVEFKNSCRPGSICRIATNEDIAEVDQVYRDKERESYNRKIAEKYNVPINWRENRWFVEQVRPTL